jgi:hypothetical protein
MRQLMNDNQIRDITSFNAQMKGLELLKNHPTIGSLLLVNALIRALTSWSIMLTSCKYNVN